MQSLQAHGIALDASYGQVQHAPQGPIPLHGCATGCFNAISAFNDAKSTGQGPYGQVYFGSSLVMTTQLDPSGPVSQGILTYSQASDPSSPWYENMTKLYSQKRWVKLPYAVAQLRHDHPDGALTLQTD